MCTWRQMPFPTCWDRRKAQQRSQRKDVQKNQLRYWRSLCNWVVCLKVLVRENLFYVNKESWDQNAPSNSPKASDTKIKKFGKDRVHREELSKSARLTSVVLARQNSGKDHMRKPCNKRDAPAKQHGIWRTYLQAQEFGENFALYSHWSKGNAGTYFNETRGARIRSPLRNINAHDDQKRIELRRDGHSEKVQNTHCGIDCQ